MNTENIKFTNYALIQLGQCIFGVGITEEEARENAAEFMDDGDAYNVESYRNMAACNRICVDGGLAIVPCTQALADYVIENGATQFAETDEGICLPSEIDGDESNEPVIKKFYDFSIDGWTRIAVVESDRDSGFDGFTRDKEIRESDLPEDFSSWKRYEAYRAGDASVEVMSLGGE